MVVLSIAILEKDFLYPVRLLQKSHETLGFLYAFLGFFVVYAIKEHDLKNFYDPFMGTLMTLMPSLLASGLILDGAELNLAKSFLATGGLTVFIYGLYLIINFLYNFISGSLSPEAKNDEGKSTS